MWRQLRQQAAIAGIEWSGRVSHPGLSLPKTQHLPTRLDGGQKLGRPQPLPQLGRYGHGPRLTRADPARTYRVQSIGVHAQGSQCGEQIFRAP